MTDSVKVWIPSAEGRRLLALAVPFQGLVMRRQLYVDLLQSRLEELIEADPAQAKIWLTGSPEHMPNLYTLATSNPPEDWPVQIMMSDQMMMRLDQIDWHEGSREHLSPAEMPTLHEIVEVI